MKFPIWIKYTNMQVFIIRVFHCIIKCPLSLGAYNEFLLEKKNIFKIKNDDHFCKYIPIYSFCGIFLKMPYLESVAYNDNRILIYFKNTFQFRNEWGNDSLFYLIDSDVFLWFIENYYKEFSAWKDLLFRIKVPASSNHGDFHIGNILSKDDKLFFIDWSNYKVKSSRYFDLIDFYIVAYGENSWIKNVQGYFNQSLKNIKFANIEIGFNVFIGYCIWKMAKELRALKDYERITNRKVKKYIQLLNIIDHICLEESKE